MATRNPHGGGGGLIKGGSTFIKWPEYLASGNVKNKEKNERNFIMFYFMDQGDLTNDFASTLKYSVALPIPKDPLKSTYSAGYSTGDVSAATRVALAAAEQSNVTSGGGAMGSLTSLLSSVKNIASSQKAGDNADTAKNATNALATLGNLAVPLPAGLSGVLQRVTKTVKNPYTFLIYSGPEFRSFSASWLMIPDNPEEAKAIQDICRIFKLAILPGMTSLGGSDSFKGIWKVPYLVVPELYVFTETGKEADSPTTKSLGTSGSGSFKVLQRFKTCVLKSVDVDFGGTGGMMPTFFKDGQPSAISLNISFQETVKLTQEDVMKGY